MYVLPSVDFYSDLVDFSSVVLITFFLISLAVFPLLLIVEHAEVGGIARLADATLFYGLAHGAVRLMGVGAVAIAAVGRDGEYLAEVMTNLLLFHIEGAEALHSRCVNEPPVIIEGEHLGEGGGVHACIVAFRNFCCAQTEVGK